MAEKSESKNWFHTLPGVLTGLAAVVGAITTLVVTFAGEKPSAGANLKPKSDGAAIVESCASRPGYPLGRWGVSVESATPATYSNFVTFTGTSTGTWLPTSGKGSFQTSVVPAPGKAVVITLSMEPGAYTSESRLVVSADGCTMNGTFLDSERHQGEVFYRWQGGK